MPIQDSYLSVFAKDTCVLIVAAYFLTRGRLLKLLFRQRLTPGETITLGVCLGAAGFIASLLPEPRFPYAVHTLFTSFATIVGGPIPGLIAASMVSAGVLFTAPRIAVGTLVAVLVSAPASRYFRRSQPLAAQIRVGFAVAALAQTCRLVAHEVLRPVWHTKPLPFSALASIPANGLGIVLLLLVVNDARVRAESEVRRSESERAHTMAAEARLSALRAQVRPHFLFNAINAIAALCRVAPDRAEAACVSLGRIMRRSLDAGSVSAIPLRDELEVVRAYIQIESERLGSRLQVDWQVEREAESCCVPPFSVETLVENAIAHGVARKIGPGRIAVIARPIRSGTLIGVRDDGPGIIRRAETLAGKDSKGLDILAHQLDLLHGRRGRLRIMTKEGHGTLAVFAIPAVSAAGSNLQTRGQGGKNGGPA